MIEIDSFSKKYGACIAVEDVSFRVEPGVVTGLLGPNGAGKTTLLKAVCGVHYATSGRVLVCGVDVAQEPVHARELVGYVSEQPALIGAYTTSEFLVYAARLRLNERDVAEWRRGVSSAVERVSRQCGLESVMHKKISTLSKGYRQRLSLAQALLHNPPVLVLDEPVSGLDPAQIRQMRDLVRGLSSERTVLLSTHLMQEVEALCDTVHIISRGKLVASGTARKIATDAGCDSFEDAFLRLTYAGDEGMVRDA